MSRAFSFTLDTPIGPLTFAVTDLGLIGLRFARDRAERVPFPQLTCGSTRHPLTARVARELSEYFEGRRNAFDLPLVPAGTDFQKAVWKALRKIPYGETRSYAELARSIGRPGSARAVGAAVGKNPWGIVVPCHRVIGSDGRLTGFAGGMRAKTWLLSLEGRGTSGARG